MELVNVICKVIDLGCGLVDFVVCEVVIFIVQVLFLVVLYLVEEMWEMFGLEFFVVNFYWFIVDEKLLVVDKVIMVVQVMGKVCVKFIVSFDIIEVEVCEVVLVDVNVQWFIEGKEIVKIIVKLLKMILIVVK